MTVSGKQQRGSDIRIHCEYILKKYETLQGQEVTLLPGRSDVAPGPCPLSQEQEVQSEGRRGAEPGWSTRLSGLGPTDSPAPLYSPTCPQDAEQYALVCLWTSPLSRRGRGHSQDAMAQNCHWSITTVSVDGFHLQIAQWGTDRKGLNFNITTYWLLGGSSQESHLPLWTSGTLWTHLSSDGNN